MSEVVCEVSCWRFLAGRCSQSGRPAAAESDPVENNQGRTVQERQPALKTSTSVKLLVKMKNMSDFTEKAKWTFLVNPIFLS